MMYFPSWLQINSIQLTVINKTLHLLRGSFGFLPETGANLTAVVHVAFVFTREIQIAEIVEANTTVVGRHQNLQDNSFFFWNFIFFDSLMGMCAALVPCLRWAAIRSRWSCGPSSCARGLIARESACNISTARWCRTRSDRRTYPLRQTCHSANIEIRIRKWKNEMNEWIETIPDRNWLPWSVWSDRLIRSTAPLSYREYSTVAVCHRANRSGSNGRPTLPNFQFPNSNQVLWLDFFK